MSLYTTSNNTTVQAQDINQMIKVLQQPSGGQEKGRYFLEMPGYTNAALASAYMPSLSRGSTPVSVSIDAADQANNGYQNSTPSTNILTSGGFQIYNHTNGANANPVIGGNWTIQY